MPVRSRSRCSIFTRKSLPLRLNWRSSSSSESQPAAITPPSEREIGGSGMMDRSMRSRTSPSSSMAACSVWSRAADRLPSTARTAGIFPRDEASASRSRGFAVSSVTRLSRRSRSSTPSSERRSSSRAMVRLTCSSTASSRAAISAASSAGRSIHARSRRLPIGVTVASIARNSVTAASPAANSGSINSRLRTVTASSTRQFWRS